MPCADGGTSLAHQRHQRGLGAPRYLVQSTIMLVLLGAPVSHTIGTSGALLGANASTSIGSCLVCLREPCLHSIGTTGALDRRGASSIPGTCLCFWGTCLAHHQHQRGLGARGCLDQHQLMPCAAGVTWLSQHRHQKGFGVPRWLEQYRLMLVMLGALFSHTSSTSGALVRGHASTSIGSCPVLMGAPCSQSIDTSRVLVLQIKKIIMFT